MNKKIFTLLAASLMLLLSTMAANATAIVGDPVTKLPDGVGKGAYHLKVTAIGSYTPTGDSVLALTGDGHVILADSTYLFSATASDAYRQLREALWCINVTPEARGVRPTFRFTNKEYGMDLAFLYNKDRFKEVDYYSLSEYTAGTSPVVHQKLKIALSSRLDTAFVVDGTSGDWYFSDDYHSNLTQDHYLAIDLEKVNKDLKDFFVTLAWNADAPHYDDKGVLIPTEKGAVQLIMVHYLDLRPGALFYEKELIRFKLVTAAPRVLTADDFNSRLGEQSTSGDVQLTFTPDKSNTTVRNPFSESPLTAEKGVHEKYIKLKTSAGDYISVDSPENYANAYGKKYLQLTTVAKGAAYKTGLDEFRLLYYPTEDSLVINAFSVWHDGNTPYHPNNATTDDLTYNIDDFYNQKIYDALIVRAQTLDAIENKVIITVDNMPSNVHISFGLGDCVTDDTNRTTVPTDLYLIKDSRGRYLAVPLYAGDFSPKWVPLAENEDPWKTPAFHWLAVKVSEENKSSKIHLVNREFEDVHIDYVQVYKTWKAFNGYPVLGDRPYGYADLTADITFDGDVSSATKTSFIKVVDDPAALAEYNAAIKNKTEVPAYVWEKLYRTSPYLGYKYIYGDTLSYYSYAFNYLNAWQPNSYLGFGEDQKLSDTTLQIVVGPQYFDLVLPDTIRAYGDEFYGIGYDKGANKYIPTEALVDSLKVKKLIRRYYNMVINDVSYWNYTRNDNYICLNNNKRYGYTTEKVAFMRELPASKFYLRFTYQPKGEPEYYTLLDRIDVSDFHHLTAEYQLHITDTLKAIDNSHNGITSFGFGVLQAAVDDNDASVSAQVKTIGSNRVSTFALVQTSEPLYRRFNNGKLDGGDDGVDAPRVLKFHEYYHKAEYLYEDRMGPNSYIPGYAKKINYLGTENKYSRDAALADDPLVHAVLATHNYAIYVDTAYVNRGTGWIKPQYLLAMDPQILSAAVGCAPCGTFTPVGPATYGRYLINAFDSARSDPNNIAPNRPARQPNGADYIWATTWERLVFVPAIHIGDSLFILNGFTSDFGNPKIDKYMYKKDGVDYLNLETLNSDASKGIIAKKMLDNNFHKDYVFQFRYVERQYGNNGQLIPDWEKKQYFLIESETTNRSTTQGRMIAPMQGGWVKIDNEVPVISRSAYDDAIREAEIFDVEPTTDAPLANATVDASKVTVLSATGAVSILNAAGKSVVISNVLGQVVAKTVLTSDHATVAAPKGVVVVAVEGENAVKAIVK